MGRNIRVVVITPHDLSRNGLVALLDRPGTRVHVVAAYRGLEEGEPQLAKLDPHILLLDDTLPPGEDINAILIRLHKRHPHLGILILSGRLHTRYLQMVFGAGASGFIYREDRLEESLTAGIEVVHQGYFYTSPHASGLLINSRLGYTPMRLNQTDFEVLRLIDHGLTMKQIAASLALTLRSVYRIRSKLRNAVGAPTHEHLIAAARKKGLLSEGRDHLRRDNT
jgi:two-component system response regulator NreC